MRSFLAGAALALCASLTAGQTIVQIAEATPELADLVDAVVAGGLVNTLNGPGPFTVFAPVNTAFDALGRNILDFVFNPHNQAALDNILTYHVVSGAVKSNQLYNGEVIPTLDNKLTVTAHVSGNSISINNAQVVKADVIASNGVVHLVDAVLVPSNFALPPNDIVKTALSVSQLSTLVTAVQAANVTALLSMPNGPYAVFAPTNDAFAKLPTSVLNYLLSHPTELRNVLFYHLLPFRVYAEEIKNFARFRTIQGGDIVFTITSSGSVLINGVSTITAVNVDCTNGVVHLIDTVLIPNAVAERAAAWSAGAPGLPNLVQLAQSVPSLSTLVTAVVAGGLVPTLSNPSATLTVFAPNDDAFAALPDTFLQYLLNNTKILDDVLTYHVLPEVVLSKDIKNGEVVATVEGKNVTAHIIGNRVFINEAEVIAADNIASNGVAHIIDQVLLPEGTVPRWMKKSTLRAGKAGRKL